MLEDVVGSAEAAEVAAAGQSAVVLGGGVVEVAAPGGLTAAGEPAGQVPGGDVFLEPRRGPVGGAGRRVRAAVRGGISGHGSPGTGHGSRGGPQCPGQDPIRRVRACSRSRRGGRRVSQDVLGNGQGDAANQPYRGARSGPGVRPCPGAGSCRGAGFLPGVWSWRVVMAAGYAGDGEGVAGGGDDDPPFGAGVAGGGPGEAAGLCGGDGADPAEVARAGAVPGEYLPGQGYVEEPGDGAAVGDPGAGAGEGGRDQRGQIRPVRRQPPIIVMLGVDVSGVAGRAVTGAGIVVAGGVLVTGWWHVPGRVVLRRPAVRPAATRRVRLARRIITRIAVRIAGRASTGVVMMAATGVVTGTIARMAGVVAGRLAGGCAVGGRNEREGEI